MKAPWVSTSAFLSWSGWRISFEKFWIFLCNHVYILQIFFFHLRSLEPHFCCINKRLRRYYRGDASHWFPRDKKNVWKRFPLGNTVTYHRFAQKLCLRKYWGRMQVFLFPKRTMSLETTGLKLIGSSGFWDIESYSKRINCRHWIFYDHNHTWFWWFSAFKLISHWLHSINFTAYW